MLRVGRLREIIKNKSHRPALLLDAVGSAPMKDTWWSTSRQAGAQPYPITQFEAPDLHALVAVLSLGPVAPGDAVGFMNATLLRSTARADGLLLRPDRPCLALDEGLLQGGSIGFCNGNRSGLKYVREETTRWRVPAFFV